MTFDDYELHKTTVANAAEIAPLVTDRDEAAESGLAAIGNPWSRAMFGGLFYLSHGSSADLPAVNLVFVQSRDGNTVIDDPASFGGGAADKHLIYEGLSRVAADAVLAGSRSIGRHVAFSVWRRELVALRAAMSLPRHPVQIAATLQGLDVESGLLFNTPELRVILLTGARGAAAMRHALRRRPWIETVVMEDPADPRDAFAELKRRGIDRISCIGGRTLAAPLLAAGLVQDVYLTTGTKEGGEPGTPLSDKPLLAREMVRKHGTGQDEGMVFQHLVIQEPI